MKIIFYLLTFIITCFGIVVTIIEKNPSLLAVCLLGGLISFELIYLLTKRNK